ncbi:MAG: Ig-like domain-containing protein, partial [bacterium]|nr:Ig-like domain-containing protein [bacterium]
YQILEERDEDGNVFKRYTYGNGIDEPVEIETDEDKDGTFNSYLPMQNTIGSVIGVADNTGNLVEKVIYTTYGVPTFIYDEEAPKVDVLRTLTGNIVIRFFEPVDKSSADNAIKIKKGVDIIPGSIAYSDDDKVATFTPSTALSQGETLTVLVTVDLKDTFDNSLENEFSQDFNYAGTDVVIYDRIPPDVEAIYFRAGEFFVEFSEEIHPGSIADSIDLSSSQGTLTGAVTQEDSKTLKFVPSSNLTGSIEYTVNIRTSPTDLSGKSLAGVFSEAFIYTGKDEFI